MGKIHKIIIGMVCSVLLAIGVGLVNDYSLKHIIGLILAFPVIALFFNRLWMG